MYGKRSLGAAIGASIALAMLVQLPQTKPTVPPPPEYQFVEYAWLKEDCKGPEDWKQYNNTGWNRLNLTYRFSKVDLAYVARTDAGSGAFQVTFIVYHNSSASSGFDQAGYLYPGSQPNWSITVQASFHETSGAYTYHLFVTTFDPYGVPGDYQVRINETGPGSGSSWTHPSGNPNVQWMFFHLPTSEPQVSVRDQMNRTTPFYLDSDFATTFLNATVVITPPGNQTGAASATFDWCGPGGDVIMSHVRCVRFVPGSGWVAIDVVAANVSAFPFNATSQYSVRVTLGYFIGFANFSILSAQWIAVKLDVRPIQGQWFDPSSFEVAFTAVVNTGLPDNPYARVNNLTLQLWGTTGFLGWLSNLSWDITGYPVVPGSSYTYTHTKMIPANLIDRTGDGSEEFFGVYWIKAKPTPGTFPATATQQAFYVDDPIEAYPSYEKGSRYGRTTFKAGDTIWMNIELDPTYLRSRMNSNENYLDKVCWVMWEWPNPGPEYIKQESVQAQKDPSWPSNQYWAFSTINTTSSFPDGVYRCRIAARCNSGYVVWELRYFEIIGSYTPRTESPPVPPYTVIKPASSDEWHTTPVMIQFYAADPSGPFEATGVKRTFYQIDNGPVKSFSGWPHSFQAPEGSHIYTYWSEDYAGNVEVPKTALIKVDTCPPKTTIWPSPSKDPYPPPLTIHLLAEDPEPGSGVAKTFYAIDSQNPIQYGPDGFQAPEGEHLYAYWSLDAAGNCETMKQAWIKVGIPEGLGPALAGSILFRRMLWARRRRARGGLSDSHHMGTPRCPRPQGSPAPLQMTIIQPPGFCPLPFVPHIRAFSALGGARARALRLPAFHLRLPKKHD